MPIVLLTAAAKRDLLDIGEYIAQESIAGADAFVAAIGRKCIDIAGAPHSGRAREELATGLRNYPVGNYVVFYRPRENGIEVIRVLSGARDINSIF